MQRLSADPVHGGGGCPLVVPLHGACIMDQQLLVIMELLEVWRASAGQPRVGLGLEGRGTATSHCCQCRGRCPALEGWRYSTCALKCRRVSAARPCLLLQGGDLRAALSADSEGELSWRRKGRPIALDIVGGLCFLHANNVTHRRVDHTPGRWGECV